VEIETRKIKTKKEVSGFSEKINCIFNKNDILRPALNFRQLWSKKKNGH
jgi:hypothetical protein